MNAPAPVVAFVRRTIKCEGCGGAGVVVDTASPYGSGFGAFAQVSTCRECEGTGYRTPKARAVRR